MKHGFQKQILNSIRVSSVFICGRVRFFLLSAMDFRPNGVRHRDFSEFWIVSQPGLPSPPAPLPLRGRGESELRIPYAPSNSAEPTRTRVAPSSIATS